MAGVKIGRLLMTHIAPAYIIRKSGVTSTLPS